MAVIKDLGAVSAYALAVEGGYTGTQEEFEQLMASYATVAQQAKQSAEDAEAYAIGKRDGTDVDSSDPAYHNNAAYYAGQASDSATGAASARDDAVSAKNDAADAKDLAVGAKDLAVGAKNDAVSARGDAVSAKEAAVSAKNDAADAKTAAETAQGKAEDAQESAEAAQAAAEAAAASFTVDSAMSDSSTNPVQNKVINAELSGLKSHVSATEIVVQSDSHPIVQIADGSANNAKSYDVQITPAQDLHGYDHPWPAGGGKNKYSMPDTTFVQFEEVEIDEIPAGTYTYSGVITSNDTDSNDCAIIFLDAGKNLLSSKALGRSTGTTRVSTTSFTTSVPIKYVRIYASNGFTSGEGDTATFKDNMIESGSTATSYAPYSNICPISGWTGAEVKRRGKNLLDWGETYGKYYLGGAWYGTGEKVTNFTPSSSLWGSTKVPVTPGTTVTVSGFADVGGVNGCFTTADGETLVGSTWGSAGNNAVRTVPDRAAYMWLGVHLSSTDVRTTYAQAQCELGSTATPYEPYSGADYSISFPQSAGTVYGGSLHVNEDGSGTLAVDKGYVDLGTLTGQYDYGWQYITNDGDPYFRVSISDKKAGLNMVCSNYATNATTGTSSLLDKRIGGSTSAERLFLRDSSYTSLDSFLAAMDGVDLVYELATPQTYTLTAPQIALLLGTNNIWADTGDMAVEYIADTKLYIQTLTRHPDEDMIADSNITSGSFFMIGNTLYLATSNIANGSTVVPGTNCTQMSLAAALNSINA